MEKVNSNSKREDVTKENLKRINLKVKENMNLAMDKFLKVTSTKI